MLIERKSMISGKTTTMDLPVTQEQLDNYYKNRVLLQDAFPNLSPEDREFIKTGITPQEWNETFKEEDDGSEADTHAFGTYEE